MINVDNKFEVGELVKVKDSTHTNFRIQQIETATCSGGTQIFYVGHIVFLKSMYPKDNPEWMTEASRQIKLHEMMLSKLEKERR